LKVCLTFDKYPLCRTMSYLCIQKFHNFMERKSKLLRRCNKDYKKWRSRGEYNWKVSLFNLGSTDNNQICNHIFISWCELFLEHPCFEIKCRLFDFELLSNVLTLATLQRSVNIVFRAAAAWLSNNYKTNHTAAHTVHTPAVLRI